MIHAHKIFIRTRKEDSALIYHILEANEGLVAYSTLDFNSHDPFRDLELLVPPDQLHELEDLLESVKEFVIRLPSHPSVK